MANPFIIFVIFSTFACVVLSNIELESLHRQLQVATERDLQFSKLSYDAIIETFNELQQRFPQYIRVHDAVEEFTALNRTLPKTRCFASGTTERACKYIYAELTNFSNPEHVNFTQSFFSGNFHGDETVGPNVVTFLAKYILEQTYTNLLNYSYIVLMPLGNPSGYFDVSREERQYFNSNKYSDKTIDMNRDFPYDQSSLNCFKTAGARVINYIWQNHLFTAAITFHGGMTAIGWPWGSNNHAIQMNRGHLAPDHLIMLSLAKKMQYTAKRSESIPQYPIDTLTNGIYAVSGTFEDWSYAASWEKQFDLSASTLPKCSSVSEEENYMDDNIARSLTYLIETSYPHNPDEETYGNWKEVADSNKGIGNVSRNIRLTLEFIENITPFHKIKIAQNDTEQNAILSWELNGCEKVDNTRVYLRQQTNLTMREESSNFNPIKDNYLSDEELKNDGFKLFKEISSYPGSLLLTQASQNITFELDHDGEKKVDIVFVSSCDSAWTQDFLNGKPTRSPQSHFARRIKDENYLVQNKGFSINSKTRIINSYSQDNLIIIEQQQQEEEQSKQQSKQQDIDTPLSSTNQAGQEQYLFILGGVLLIGAGVSLIVFIIFRRLRQNNIQFKEIQDEELQNANPHSHHQQKASVFLMGKDTRENAAHFGI